jgi:hypothetical protein
MYTPELESSNGKSALLVQFVVGKGRVGPSKTVGSCPLPSDYTTSVNGL